MSLGRPKKTEKLYAFTVMLKQDDINEIKEIAERAELSAGRLARNCLLSGLEDARILDRIGFVRLIGGSKRAIAEIKKRFEKEIQDIQES